MRFLEHPIAARFLILPILLFLGLLSITMPVTVMKALIEIGEVIKGKWNEKD